jgi:hypothetical protein
MIRPAAFTVEPASRIARVRLVLDAARSTIQNPIPLRELSKFEYLTAPGASAAFRTGAADDEPDSGATP